MTLKQLHAKADKELKKAAQPVLDSENTKSLITPIANNHNISVQTVLNYIYGAGKDGFLKQVILRDIKKITETL